MNLRRSLLGWMLVLGGFVAVVAGWVSVQSTRDVPVQVAYLASGGIVGVALVALGTGLVANDDLRAIRAAVEELRDRFDDIELDLADTREIVGPTARQARQDGSKAGSTV